MSTTSLTKRQIMPHIHIQRGFFFGALMVSALIAFEAFNYSTTEFALTDLLGDLKFASIRWATILTIAFCGIDFAGIARLFSPPEKSGALRNNISETWYLFGAWLLAATMNAMLTWWGISLAVLEHQTLGGAVIDRATILKVVPIFVALMVWLIRVLIIGTFSARGEEILARSDRQISGSMKNPGSRPIAVQPTFTNLPQVARPASQASTPIRPTTKGNPNQVETGMATRPELSYHPLSANASSIRRDQTNRGGIDPSRNNSHMRQ